MRQAPGGQLHHAAGEDAEARRVDAVLGVDGTVLWVTDRKGREVGVPSDKITYVELGSAADSRPMGFSS